MDHLKLAAVAVALFATASSASAQTVATSPEPAAPSAAPVSEAERTAIKDMFELCVGQEDLGEPGSCWSLFVKRNEGKAELAQIAYAKGAARRAEFKKSRTCAEQQRWDGKACVDRCAEYTTWDGNRRLCLSDVERACFEGNELNSEGRCVKLGCPSGQTRDPSGTCVYEAVFRSGMPVKATSAIGDAIRAGDRGTVWGFHAEDGYAFVVFQRKIGDYNLKYGYPSDEGVPQGKPQNSIWMPQDWLTRDFEMDGKIVPQWCGQTDDTLTHGAVKIGTWVVLGRHRQVQGEDNWADEMAPFVGKRTQVKELRTGTDTQGCPYVRVRADEGKWNWRLRDLKLAAAPKQGDGAPY